MGIPLTHIDEVPPGERSSSINSSITPDRSDSSAKEHTEELEIGVQQNDTQKAKSWTAQIPTFPEGGLHAWLTVLGGTMVTFCTFGVVQSFGVYQDYYARIALPTRSPAQISLIGSLQVFFVFAIGLPAGRLFDAGYFRVCLAGGSLLYIFSSFMLSIAQPGHYYQFLLSQGIGMGIGMGFMFLPSLTITSHYFKVKRSLAMGIVIAGSSIGGIIYPILLNNVFSSSAGFGWGVRAVAFMDLGFLLTANCIMRTRLPPLKASQNAGGATFLMVVKDLPFMLYVLGAFLSFWGIFVPFFYLQVHASLHGVDPVFVRYAITIMNGASLFGRTLPNFLADYIGPLNVMGPSAFISASLIFGMFGASDIAGVTTFAIFYGFFSGGVVSISAPAVGSFITHPDLSDFGIRIGILSFALAFALLTGNPIAGALLTSNHIWYRPLIFAAVVVFAGSACFALIWKSVSTRRKSSKI
ncbi:major facilitator superfamily domain-containing protein [Crepidotus variabilis]|uniref:Major facilitator superfamily domain-containing protein n=1 Tax=Crepidotus variabilis TaxID=179855 RepID=A0A9P6ED38_9AGAR|nr:major facilitator superfamily domain-containing protein [Crepidotus variabilis]